MAAVTMINMDGKIVNAVNISGIVGFAGANQRDDVLLIQGLFNFIAKGLAPSVVGLGGEYQIPRITGEMDADTYSAISEFQVLHASQLLMKWFDGRVHPASYENRRLSSRARRFMMITLLHIYATDAAVMEGYGSEGYIQGLAALDSQLATVIDMAIINS